MVPIYSEEEHYRVQAQYFANAALLLGCVASVHLEDSEDELFWKPLLLRNSKGTKFNFLYYSQSHKGNKTTGVNQCLKYLPYLSNQFFICIDSDYRYLLQEVEILTNPFVFQTYTYSFENHLCYSGELNVVCEQATNLENSIFDFEQFLLSYSQTVYDAFIWHLYFIKYDESKFSKSEFTELINLKEHADINDNGGTVVQILKQRCDCIVAKLQLENPTVNIVLEKAYYDSFGVKPVNVYLYVRGHDLFDLICELGNRVSYQLLNQEKEKFNGNNIAITDLYKKSKSFKKCMLRHIVFNSYPEIIRIETDINSFFEKIY